MDKILLFDLINFLLCVTSAKNNKYITKIASCMPNLTPCFLCLDCVKHDCNFIMQAYNNVE